MMGFYIFDSMKMKRLYLILVLMTVSLIGIVLVQWLWIRNALDIREENYDRDVREALAQTVSHLDKRRNMVFMSERMGAHLPDSLPSTQKLFPADSMSRVVEPREMARFYRQQQQEVEREIREQHHVISEHRQRIEEERLKRQSRDSIIQIRDSLVQNQDSLRQKIILSMNDKRMVVDSLKNLSLPDLEALEGMKLDMGAIYKELQKIDMETFQKQLEEQTQKMEEVFREMAFEYRMHFDSIQKRLPYEELDTLLSQELSQRGIDADYAYAVADESSDKLLHQSSGFQPDEQEKAYRINFYPSDLIRKNIYLLLQIPHKQSLILQSISYLLVGSLLFTAVIIITFGITLHTLLRQKKLSDIKSDFINNMTHEFKTPIATISLAADSIANPKTLQNKENILHFLKVIKSENKRMNSQVERVLQMSLLDKKDFHLEVNPAHIHPLLEQVVNNTQVQLDKNGGTIHYDPAASNDLAAIDEEHFLNVLYNLIDNAIKYSSASPQIQVSTQNDTGSLQIVVKDQGIGIRPEDQRRIFDKFYRVSSGNVHDVKGFGLGLSYVKTMIRHFGGDIQVTSQLGKGTRFVILLPLKSSAHEEA